MVRRELRTTPTSTFVLYSKYNNPCGHVQRAAGTPAHSKTETETRTSVNFRHYFPQNDVCSGFVSSQSEQKSFWGFFCLVFPFVRVLAPLPIPWGVPKTEQTAFLRIFAPIFPFVRVSCGPKPNKRRFAEFPPCFFRLFGFWAANVHHAAPHLTHLHALSGHSRSRCPQVTKHNQKTA